MLQEDLGLFFADMGVTAIWVTPEGQSITAQVLLDEAEAASMGEMVDGRVPIIVYPTDTFPGIGHGDTVTVDGALYRVETVRQQHDGRLSEALLTVFS
jgi:hypothetical protein